MNAANARAIRNFLGLDLRSMGLMLSGAHGEFSENDIRLFENGRSNALLGGHYDAIELGLLQRVGATATG